MDFHAAAADDAQRVFAELEEPATWTPAGGSAMRIGGIYRRVSELVDIGDIIESDGVAVQFNVATAKIAGAAIGDTVVVRNDTYRVVGLEPTGHYRTVMVLGV